MEGQPLYNAINFNWVCCWRLRAYINSTATLAIINTFICPSDGLSPVHTQNDVWTGNTNNYFASVGASTDFFNPSGLFAEAKICFGVQECTDGSSNTIAFGEALVGPNGQQQVKWRSGPVLAAGSALCKGGWCGINDVRRTTPVFLPTSRPASRDGWPRRANITEGIPVVRKPGRLQPVQYGRPAVPERL